MTTAGVGENSPDNLPAWLMPASGKYAAERDQ